MNNLSLHDVGAALDELGKFRFGDMRVEDALHEIVRTTHAMFGVDGAGLMLTDAEQHLRSVAASDARLQHLEAGSMLMLAPAFFFVLSGKTPPGSNRLRLRSCPRRHRSSIDHPRYYSAGCRFPAQSRDPMDDRYCRPRDRAHPAPARRDRPRNRWPPALLLVIRGGARRLTARRARTSRACRRRSGHDRLRGTARPGRLLTECGHGPSGHAKAKLTRIVDAPSGRPAIPPNHPPRSDPQPTMPLPCWLSLMALGARPWVRRHSS